MGVAEEPAGLVGQQREQAAVGEAAAGRRHLRRDPGADLATLAYTYGYADQAHLTREVRALTGCTPVQLRTLEMRARARLDAQRTVGQHMVAAGE